MGTSLLVPAGETPVPSQGELRLPRSPRGDGTARLCPLVHRWGRRQRERALCKGGPLLSPLDTELLEILVCPETHRPVVLAESGVLERVNHAVQAGVLRNRGGEVITTPLEGLLVRDDGLQAYPVRDDIPIMLIDESIDLAGLEESPALDAPQSP